MVPEVEKYIKAENPSEEQLAPLVDFAYRFLTRLNIRFTGEQSNNDLDLLEAYSVLDPRPVFKAKNKVASARARVCVCVCVCPRARVSEDRDPHMFL
jgi:hypothetical protein